MRHWYIYRIVSPSNNVYIGITSNIKKRISYYRNYKKLNQPKLKASFSKHGFEIHKIDIIDQFYSDLKYAHGKEMFWIRSYMSNCLKWENKSGLNLTDGGQGTIGWRASEEHKAKLSLIHKANPSRGMLGKKMSDEQKKKLSEINIKNPPRGMLGKKISEEEKRIKSELKLLQSELINKSFLIRKHSPEAKLKMSLAKRGKPAHNKGKPMPLHQKQILIKINTGRPSGNKGKVFIGTEEERKRRFGLHNIGNNYNRGRKQSAEVIEAKRLRLTGKPNVALYKPIVQYDHNGVFINEYDSIKNASREVGLSEWTIGNIAKGNNKKKHIFDFKYKN